MKKLLSSVLTLTLILNFFGVNWRAENEIQSENSEVKVSEEIKQINDNLAQIKNKNSTETEEKSTEEVKSSETAENVSSEAQKDTSKPAKKSFREKQIEKLNKEIQNLEKTSNKKYLWKKFFINTAKILVISEIMLRVFYNVGSAVIQSYNEGYTNGFNAGFASCPKAPAPDSELKEKFKSVVKSILTKLHPDNFKNIKSFDDIKEFYYKINNFYDDYLK